MKRPLLVEALHRHLERCLEEAPELAPEVRELIRLVEGQAAGDVDATRYEDLGRIGLGGMGEVRRVRDRQLSRVVAMKVDQSDATDAPQTRSRFLREARATAQLQHPNIVPVYEMGQSPQGALYFTMKEVRGRTFLKVLQEFHANSRGLHERNPSGWSFRRLISVVHQASLAVAYAHDQGMIHRDLKPDNIMVGGFGEVQVMDWGLVKVLDAAPATSEVDEDQPWTSDSAPKTVMGAVFGTPAYMAPEQARGEVDRVDQRTDVYGLGAILYEVLSGRPPYTAADSRATWQEVLRGPPPPPAWPTTRGGGMQNYPTHEPDEAVGDQPTVSFTAPLQADQAPPQDTCTADVDLPPVLVEVCNRAMARSPEDRHPSAAELAADLEAWLDGTRAYEQARAVVQDAEAKIPEIEALRKEAARRRAQAQQVLEEVPSWAWNPTKTSGWALEDEATAMERRAEHMELELEHMLQGALTHAADLPEAHAALVAQYQDRHREAEARQDSEACIGAEFLLRAHAEALPETHPTRREVATYLRGEGALSLATEPAGAEVLLSAYVQRDRHLVLEPVRSLERTPLREVPLPMGSYQCLIRAEGHADVAYPVHIGRCEHWHGIRPGGTDTHPIALPRHGDLGPDDCYVPAGWFRSGGDPEAFNSLPARRLWCDAFVIRRFPVTNTEYIAFLDDLTATGREDEALRHVPRQMPGQTGEVGPMIYGRDPDGRFVLVPDGDGDLWMPEWPVVYVDWYGALAYADWASQRDGLPWRLAWELEWEKAARGVDGRTHPWGNNFDPSWCCMGQSHSDRRLAVPVDRFPLDESPFGVRGMAGNVMEWTMDTYRQEGVSWADALVSTPHRAQLPLEADHTRRGGAWNMMPMCSRGAYRGRSKAGVRLGSLGFRLARGVDGGTDPG